ncbi:DUF885 domain-containing protein [Sphingomonas cavernae]|uniref:DUF885 domain-containing protein n=1 Tax=Sphingomonas cavernae TaxID=2320861 RepID=A0A418WJL0_9SPHN|nr:DUF885 family protein [Sphingomonas cavernae]RJF90180.1 DUF885 domain-containing protein [Sphingomonas cavernae]
MAQFDRRQFLEAAGTLAALQFLPATARAAAPQTAPDAAAERLLSGIAEALLAEYPENAGALGLDKDARRALKSRLTDRSPDGMRSLAAIATKRLAQLRAVDTGQLSPAVRNDVAVVTAAHELAVEGFGFGFGDVVTLSQQWSYRNAPYVVAQNTGAFVEVPDFLDSNHAIADAADADAYLARLEAYAHALDGETARLKHDGAKGVIAPAFLLDKTIAQMKASRAQPVAEWTLVASLARRTKDFGKDYASRAARLATDKVAPALDRQIAELERHRARATADAGVWKLPEGESYYGWALRAATTSRLSPDEVHRLGQAQLAELHAQMEVLLRAEGLTRGTVGERMTALGKDPRYLYPNTDAGRAQILDYINGRVADIRERLPRAFATLVPGRLIVKRVPPEIEAGAPGGYAAAGTIDGSVPGNYYINLRDTSIWPRYALPTLTYHEGIPGHIWQGEYSYKLPLVRSLLAFNAYSEGWALYAEQIADELGVYEGDPLGRLGYLQSMAFRACRLVVDTGLHAKRWTRDHAIQWFASTNGSTVEEVSSEVDRYCAWPGQACGYKAGHIEINRLREKAKGALGARYDVKRFNDAVVKAGGVPLTVLEQVIEAHISAFSKA